MSLSTRFDSRGCSRCARTAPANLRPLYQDVREKNVPGGDDAVCSLWRYASALPSFGDNVISLGEGLTPLTPAARLGSVLDIPHLFIKNEGCNPTWSHKDRFSTVAVTAAVERGATVVATASSGNAGASLAAYAAKAGLECVVATFAGASGAMISQIQGYGATILPMVRKSDRWEFLAEAAENYGWYVTSPYRSPVIGSNPVGIEGYKTIAYEILDQSHGRLPDWCILPVCYGDALSGIASGFRELREMGQSDGMPKLVAAEVHGSLSVALENGTDMIEDQDSAFDTIALSIGTTRSTYQALRAIRDTQGCAVLVANDQLRQMQRMLAVSEGIFAELAAVAPLVAVQELRRKQVIGRDDRVVVVVTASGLKDIEISAQPGCNPQAFSNIPDAWNWLRENKPDLRDRLASVRVT